MRDSDEKAIRQLLGSCDFSHPIERAVGLSPDVRETRIVKDFLGVDLEPISREQWDVVERPWPHHPRPDIIVACNVFMYVSDVGKAMDNVLASCRYFLMQDNVRAHRGPSELGNDGDRNRFGLANRLSPLIEGASDLGPWEDRLVHLLPFEFPSGCGVDGYNPGHAFVALFRGDR